MSGAFNRIVIGSLIFAITLVVAVIGYIEFGWTVLEAIYMVVITIFGVGYGEVKPLESAAQKIFTMFVIIAGTSSAVYIIGGFVQMLTEGEINRALSEKRRERTIAGLHFHAIVCGFGRMGQVLARQLQESHEAFIIIDPNPEAQHVYPDDYLVYHGNPADEEVLQAVGIDRARALITVLPDDATNVYITLTARELNPTLMILARGELPTTEKKLRLAGADHVVLPDTISGMRMANLLTRPTALDFLSHPDERSYLNELLGQIDVQMEELSIPPNSMLANKSVREVEVRGKGTFIVVALRRSEGTVQMRPNPSQLLNSGDTLIVVGHRRDLRTFAQRYVINQRTQRTPAQANQLLSESGGHTSPETETTSAMAAWPGAAAKPLPITNGYGLGTNEEAAS